jgi:hypothetical protein
VDGAKTPGVAAVLAVAWIAAIAIDRPLAVAAVVLAGLATPVLLAPRRSARGTRIGAACCAVAIGLLLLVTALAPTGGAVLAVMVVWALLAGVTLPLVYARTFDDGPPESS